jgi:hypothetical protein
MPSVAQKSRRNIKKHEDQTRARLAMQAVAQESPMNSKDRSEYADISDGNLCQGTIPWLPSDHGFGGKGAE